MKSGDSLPQLPAHGALLQLAILKIGTSCALAVVPVDLRCEYLSEPLGVDAAVPRLSWKLADADAVRGQKQTAWQIRAASRLELLEEGRADLWGSGVDSPSERADDQAHLVPPQSEARSTSVGRSRHGISRRRVRRKQGQEKRIHQHSGTADDVSGMAAYYFGKGEPSPHPNMLALATSACRPPLVVADIALDREGRGTYVYQSRPPGLNLMPRPAEAPPAFPAYQVTIRKGHRSLTLDFSSGK